MTRRQTDSMTPSLKIHPDAARILNKNTSELPEFFFSAIEEHNRILSQQESNVLKDAPESAVTKTKVPGFPEVCVKEFRWRGLAHALKGLFRPTQGLRTFFNGQLLQEAGIGAAQPLALIRHRHRGLIRLEWIVMEVIPNALELDRYLLKQIQNDWTWVKKSRFVRSFAGFIGRIHSMEIFHSDLKTCNILVKEDSDPSFSLLDYDDIIVTQTVPFKKRIKNLVQIFLSTPIALNAVDRMRFMREYSIHAGISRHERRDMTRRILTSARGRDILYIGFDGDIVEKWE
jgi:tRNA A-37 threonylcarbamoyl transferase component Bud32